MVFITAKENKLKQIFIADNRLLVWCIGGRRGLKRPWILGSSWAVLFLRGRQECWENYRQCKPWLIVSEGSKDSLGAICVIFSMKLVKVKLVLHCVNRCWSASAKESTLISKRLAFWRWNLLRSIPLLELAHRNCGLEERKAISKAGSRTWQCLSLLYGSRFEVMNIS